MIHLKQLRAQIIERRKSLGPDYIQSHSKLVCAKLFQLLQSESIKNIGIYCAANGEIDPALFTEKTKAKLFAPRLNQNTTLSFAQFLEGKLARNRFGILEPDKSCPELSIQQLDAVVTPLVAADKALNRLGMGKGYYDTTFAYKKQSTHQKPLLIGVGYDFQVVPHLCAQAHDVPLDILITPDNTYDQQGVR